MRVVVCCGGVFNSRAIVSYYKYYFIIFQIQIKLMIIVSRAMMCS